MTVNMTDINDSLVLADDVYTHRYFDAFGPRVSKYLFDGTHWPVDDTTHDPTEWTNTITEGGAGDSTANLTDQAGGALLITTDNAENDGYAMQLGHASTGAGENVDLSGRNPLYVGFEFNINDVTQSDIFFGVAVTDTDCLGAVTDGLYFRKVDGSAVLWFVAEKDSAENAVAVATLANGTYITAEYLFDGETVRAYINGTEVTSLTTASVNFPNDELMRLTLEFLTGEAAAKICTVRWMRMVHIR